MKWEKIGVVGIDSGLCWLGDPSYCVTPDAGEHPAKTWREFCDKLNQGRFDSGNSVSKQWSYKKGHAGLGVSFSTGYGDGTYEVFAKKNKEGRISEVKIKFI